MELFDFIRVLFANTDEYNKLKRHEKAKFFFMSQRFMSIMFPLQAQAFNHLKISQAEVLDYWHSHLARLYSRIPDWIRTRTKGKKLDKIKWPSDDAVQFYLTRVKMSRRDLQDSVNLFGKAALEPIFRIEKSMGSDI